MTYPVLRQVMRTLVAVVLGRRLHVEGLDNVPRTGGALIVGNHVGAIDPPLTGALIPRFDVHYMAKSEHFAKPAVRWLFHGFQAFPVVRGSADRTALRYTLQLLNDGHIVLVYPEGSRSPDGRVQAPQAGVGFLARHAHVPIIPVAVWGTEHALPRGARWPRRVDVHLRYGKPLVLPAGGAGSRQDNLAVAALIMDAVAAMLPERYRPLPDPAVPEPASPAA